MLGGVLLARAETFGDLRDAQLLLAQQVEDPDPRRVADHAQARARSTRRARQVSGSGSPSQPYFSASSVPAAFSGHAPSSPRATARGTPASRDGDFPDALSRAATHDRCMAHRIVILGGGTGGTLVANRLQRHYGDDGARSSSSIATTTTSTSPACCSCRSAWRDPSDLVRSRRAQLRAGSRFAHAEVDRVEPTRTRCTSPTARRSPTTCSSSRAARRCCPRRPRA